MSNNKPIKKYDFKKKPKDVPSWLLFLAVKFLAKPMMKKHNFKLDKINMDGLKPPYLLLSNHGSEYDFYIMYDSIYPNHTNNVVAIDAVHDHTEWFMRLAGCICKRKFTKEMDLLRNIKYSINIHKNIVVMYPEARYTFDGTTSYLPPSLSGIVRILKVPVVVLNMRGNFISCPQWNKEKKYVPFEATMSQIVTADEATTLSADEINKRIADAFVYDDFAYQRDNNIIIDHPDRAKGLHSILYQCPACGTEHMMNSEGSELWCEKCGKRWQMTELGELRSLDGETEFTHIPDWFRWERENVRAEVRSGKYYFEDEVKIETLPNAQMFVKQGKGKLVHSINGFRIEGNIYGKDVSLEFPPLALESIHIEFNYKKMGDAVDISTPDESYWLAPCTKRDSITKLSLATEEIFAYETEKKNAARLAARERKKALAEKQSKESGPSEVGAPNQI